VPSHALDRALPPRVRLLGLRPPARGREPPPLPRLDRRRRAERGRKDHAAALCPQRVDALDAAIRSLAAATSGEAHRLLGRLRLDPSDLERWRTLSPGERKRWQIGAALAAEPDVLLLDEPTNHLDGVARDLLLGALAGFSGVGVVVSHDRALLNALTHATVCVRFARVELWRGAYDAARREWEAALERTRGEHARARREERKLQRRLVETRSRRDHADADRRTSKHMKSRKDSDMRLRYKQSRRRSAEVSLGREVGKVRRALERAERHAAGFRFDRKLGRSLFVDYRPAPVPRLLELETRELRAGGALLLRDVDVALRRESRIWLRGPNGAGKTTLLRALLAGARVPAGRLLYVPQELGPEQEVALLDSVRALPPEARGRVLALVAALGVAPDALIASHAPSPGEGRKLAIADGLGRQVWALLLDEPTNHLDLDSIERLEAALSEYPGALVLATHDGAFASSCTETVWDLVGHRLEVRSVREEG
jgi:ATPase subunit of ABC transporter with duplicated ATPase domains